MPVGQLPLVACGASGGVSVLGTSLQSPPMMQHSHPGSPKPPPAHIWSLETAPHPPLETLKGLHTTGVAESSTLFLSFPDITSLSLLVTHRPSLTPVWSGTCPISRQHPPSPGVGTSPREPGVLREQKAPEEPEQKSKGAGEGGEGATRATLGVWPYCEGSRGAWARRAREGCEGTYVVGGL